MVKAQIELQQNEQLDLAASRDDGQRQKLRTDDWLGTATYLISFIIVGGIQWLVLQDAVIILQGI